MTSLPDTRSDPAIAAAPSSVGLALSVEGLTARYRDRVALDNVTLAFPAGEITAVIGPSGCGKTTLLACLNRLTDLIPNCRVTGRVLSGGRNILDRDIDVVSLRRRVGMIFQKPNPFPLSIRRNIELPLREHGMRDRGQLAEILEQSLQEVGLWSEVKDRLDRSALALSGGQQQRLCLARALALRPEVLLFDEPCSALDPISTQTVEELLARLRQRHTLVVVTHNLAQARRIADRVALLWSEGAGGVIVEQGLAGQMFESPKHSLTAAYVAGRVG